MRAWRRAAGFAIASGRVAAVLAVTAGVLRAAALPTDAGVASTLQPGSARGDFDFQTDVAALRPVENGRALVRVLVQLPVRPFLEQTRADHADVRLRLRVFDAQTAFAALASRSAAAAEDDPHDRAESEQADVALDALIDELDDVEAIAQAERRGRVEGQAAQLLETDFRLFDLSLEVAPGDYVFEVLGENLSRGKRGLLDRLRKRPLAAVARQLVRVPDMARQPALADPTFHIGHGTRADYASRLYGLLNDSLHVRTTLFGTGPFDVRITVADRAGEVHWLDSLAVDAAGQRDIGWSTSVNTFPAGQYVLQLRAAGSGGGAEVARSFDVAWALTSWTKPRRDLDTEADLLLRDSELETYRAQPVGERERFLDRFWAAHDPSPETAVNELMDEFHRRVAYADLNFQETKRGSLSDRGRVYVHFGAPAEVQMEAVPTHLAGRGAEGAMAKVDDAYVASEHRDNDPDPMGSTQGTAGWDRTVRNQERNRVIGLANEVVSYELWLYKGGGDPLLPEDRGVAIDAGLRVLFVDVNGYGRFELRKASARLDIRGLNVNY
jgi:GWxTD domain-containing protein